MPLRTESSDDNSKTYIRFPIERTRKRIYLPGTVETKLYRFPDYATAEHRNAFKDGISQLVRCIEGRREHILGKEEIEREKKIREFGMFHTEFSEQIGEYPPKEEEFAFSQWVNGLDNIVERYSHSTRCLKIAIKHYMCMSSDINYADDIFSERLLLNKAEDTAYQLLKVNPDERKFVEYTITSIREQKRSPFNRKYQEDF
jgi:hypothetical protein